MDIERKRGDTYADEFTLTHKESGEHVDLTGCTFVLTVDSKASPTDTSTNLYQINGVVSDSTSGVVAFSPSSSQADRVGHFYFDVQMTDATGKSRTIAAGRYIYSQDITK